MEPAINTTEVHEDLIRADLAKIDQLPALEMAAAENQGAILAQYGDGLPYDRIRYLDKCRYHMGRSAEEAMEVGRCLVVMKECEGHGNWLPVLEDIGLDRAVAARLMAVAVRFSNVTSTAHLVESAKSKTKLMELLVLDDAEMSSLNSGESVRGIQLDDVERMSVSELRRALRQTRADKEAEVSKVRAGVSGELAAKDKLLADRSKRIADLVEEKNRRECLTEEERIIDLEQRLNTATLDAIGFVLPVRQAVHNIRALERNPLGLTMALENALNRIVAEVNGIAADYGVTLNLTPEWLDGGAQAGDEETGADWLTATPAPDVVAAQ